jgi:hypothetical protein
MKWPLAVLVLLAGCSHSGVRVDTLLGLTLLTAAMFDYERGRLDLAPPLSSERRINAQDCSQPIRDPSANLDCR